MHSCWVSILLWGIILFKKLLIFEFVVCLRIEQRKYKSELIHNCMQMNLRVHKNGWCKSLVNKSITKSQVNK